MNVQYDKNGGYPFKDPTMSIDPINKFIRIVPMLERTESSDIRKLLSSGIVSIFLSIAAITASFTVHIPAISYFSVVFGLAAIISLIIAKAKIKKIDSQRKEVLKTLKNETDRAADLYNDLIPVVTLLAEEDSAIVEASSAQRKPIVFESDDNSPYERLRRFADSYERPRDSSIEKVKSLKRLSVSVEALREMELRLPFIDEILKRVVAHTEQAAMTLIERFSSISEQTNKSDIDAQNAIAAIGSKNGNENGLESLIKKSHESIVGRTTVINDFLKLNRENADRVRKISELVSKSEELISGIEDITERSKLIAFNMAVESAKIGDKGLGFKVIVHELQRLNDQTTRFARDIMEIVKSFRSYNQEMLDHWLVKSESLTEQVKTDSNQAELAVTALKHSYDLSGALFKSLSDSAISVNHSMSDILESLQFQDITRQQIDGAISFLIDINASVSDLRKQFESLGYNLGDVHSVLHAIRSRHEAQLKVSKDHDIFELIERRYR